MNSKRLPATRGARAGVVALIASASLALGAPAAQAADCSTPTPATDQYCPPSFHHNSGSSGGGLPFTGYDIGLAAAAAAGLLGAGVGLRRLAAAEGRA